MSHACPVCGTSLELQSRYPRYVCQACADPARSADGRPLTFANEGPRADAWVRVPHLWGSIRFPASNRPLRAFSQTATVRGAVRDGIFRGWRRSPTPRSVRRQPVDLEVAIKHDQTDHCELDALRNP